MATNKKDMRKFIPESFTVGPYDYDVEIVNLNRKTETLHGECDFGDRKIRLAEELNYDMSKKNWTYTLEIIIHELLHAYNYNSGLREKMNKNNNTEDLEEIFVDQTARNIIQMFKENNSLLKLLSFLAK